MLKFKATVVVPKSLIIAAAASNARHALGLSGDTYVTSGNDSAHMRGSKHYDDKALDFRTKDLSVVDTQRWASATRARLGRGYQVVIESTHLHIEHDA